MSIDTLDSMSAVLGDARRQAEEFALRRIAEQHQQRQAELANSRERVSLSEPVFSFRGILAGPDLQPTIKSLPVPEKQALALAEGAPTDEYMQLADKLGIQSTAVLGAKLEAILADEFIPVFDYEKVREYLLNECNKANEGVLSLWDRKTWAWKPVRKQDRVKATSDTSIERAIYRHAIPEPVLHTMERISKRLPEAKFFVSEIVSLPDPFLAVTVSGADKMWVVERWNEPGFRG